MGETFVLFYCLCTGASEQQFYSPSWRVCVFTLTKRKGSLPIHAMSVSEKMLPYFSCCKCVMKNGSDWICWKRLCLKETKRLIFHLIFTLQTHTRHTKASSKTLWIHFSHRGSTWEYRCWQRSHDCNCAAEVKHTNTHTPSRQPHYKSRSSVHTRAHKQTLRVQTQACCRLFLWLPGSEQMQCLSYAPLKDSVLNCSSWALNVQLQACKKHLVFCRARVKRNLLESTSGVFPGTVPSLKGQRRSFGFLKIQSGAL